MKIKLTKTKPTEPGLYIFQAQVGYNHPRIVDVKRDGDRLLANIGGFCDLSRTCDVNRWSEQIEVEAMKLTIKNSSTPSKSPRRVEASPAHSNSHRSYSIFSET